MFQLINFHNRSTCFVLTLLLFGPYLSKIYPLFDFGNKHYLYSMKFHITTMKLDKINEALGTPSEENWPGVSNLPNFVALTPKRPLRDKRFFREQFRALDDDGIDFLISMLTFDPNKRPTARKALEHYWWTSEPRPTDTDKLPRSGGGEAAMAAAEVKAPGAVEEGRFKGVARRLDFGGMKG